MKNTGMCLHGRQKILPVIVIAISLEPRRVLDTYYMLNKYLHIEWHIIGSQNINV